MELQQKESPLRTEQINNAVAFGKTAAAEGRQRFPWQDECFIETLKTHQESISENATFSELFEAWLTGWDSENLND